MLQKWSTKTILLLILVLIFAFSLCACEGNSNADEDDVYDAKDDKHDSVNDREEKDDTTIASDDGRTYLDAFEGIEFVVSGISPYCQISINNQNCSNDVQRYVEYSLDKDYYANGETAVITASLNVNADREVITLINDELPFVVSGQPEYVTSLCTEEIKVVHQEMEDYVTTEIAKGIASDNRGSFFGIATYRISGTYYGAKTETVIEIMEEQQYISCLKQTKLDEIERGAPYNKYTFVLSFRVHTTHISTDAWYGEGEGYLYVAINASNVIRYPDGSIKWGTKAEDQYDFTYGTSSDGIEHCVTTCIMNGSMDYNITKIK